ncbi:MAG: hypothetical protein QM796_05775 [Chthoniobacteraceae bacterium]
MQEVSTEEGIMKIWHVIPCITVVALSACSKPESQESPAPTPTPTAPANPASAAIPLPASAPVIAAVSATPAAPNLAPAGIYFLTQRISMMTDSGIQAFPPGTKLTKLANGHYQADSTELTLQPSQVTNDLDVAAALSKADNAQRVAIRQMTTHQSTASTVATPTGTPTPTTVAEQLNPATLSAPAPAQPSTSVQSSGGLGETHTTSSSVLRIDQFGRHYTQDIFGHRHYKD